MKIAVLGTGLIGTPVAERLHAQGHEVVAWNRTKEKAEPLRRAGITVALQPEEAVREADGIVVVLADATAIRRVVLAEAVRRELPGRTVIHMGTIGPSESTALQRDIVAAGGDYLEAPILGSIAEVKAGTLFVMVGATPAQFERWSALFRCLGTRIHLIGTVGQAAALKLALNQLIAAETAAFALSLGLVQRAGVPVESFMQILRESALFAPTFDKKLPRMLKRDFGNPNFSTRHLLKDVTLCLGEARRLRLDTRSLDGMPALLEQTIAAGDAEQDYSSLYNAVNPHPDS